MYTVDPAWRYFQQLLLNATEGQDLKVQLVNCLIKCRDSHDINVKLKNEKYVGIIEWDPEQGPPPSGWYLDPVDSTWKRPENSEVDDG